ncbi:proteinase-activated receptor 3 [Oryzias melastigma]|uniref:Coagulation factor II thrombin receptor like 2 n=1 Tax=Oryzias melastigma TaxID=30732 RepID=A0A3B3CDX4_ORYME|nr:proteinase-activated receptor 3 [Oryzias melastigma]
MKTFAVFLLVALISRASPSSSDRPSSQKNVPVPRTFFGNLVPQTNDEQNSTQAGSTSASRSSFPALQALSNSTMEYLSGPLSTRVIPFTYIFVIVLGIPANVAILCFLAKKIRKVSSAILYYSLAVSDLFLLLSLTFKIHYHLHGNDWVLGEAACRVVTACFYGNLYCSAMTLACISVKRYIAVVHPFMYKGLPKKMCTAWVSLGVWGVFGIAVIPEFLIQQSYWLPQLNRTSCHDVLARDDNSFSFAFLLSYNLVLTVVGLLVPLVVSIVCYIRIIIVLKKSLQDWGKYIKASSLVFAIFLVCFLPAGFLHFIHYLQLELNGTESLYGYFNLAVCLCCLHACLDPFLFVLMSTSTGSRLFIMTFKGKSMSITL